MHMPSEDAARAFKRCSMHARLPPRYKDCCFATLLSVGPASRIKPARRPPNLHERGLEELATTSSNTTWKYEPRRSLTPRQPEKRCRPESSRNKCGRYGRDGTGSSSAMGQASLGAYVEEERQGETCICKYVSVELSAEALTSAAHLISVCQRGEPAYMGICTYAVVCGRSRKSGRLELWHIDLLHTRMRVQAQLKMMGLRAGN